MGFQNGGNDLPFTGERVVLGKTPALIVLEHLVRYRFAAGFVGGDRVLDVACGTGYGSSILAERAESVVGFDLSLETIQYARKNFSRPNLRYSIADCRSLPFQNGSFDVVVMFEAIEHIAEQEQSLGEIRRVLSPEGILILSTPNTNAPTKAIEDVNPFHYKELTEYGFLELLRPYFAHVRLFYQHELSASRIQLPAVSTSDPVNVAEDFSVPSAAKYFIAVCSAQAVPVIKGRTLGVGGIEHQIAFIKDLQKSQGQIQDLVQQKEANEREYAKALSAHQQIINAKQLAYDALARQSEARDRDYLQNLALHQHDVRAKQEALANLERKLQELNRRLAELEVQNSLRKIELEWLYHWMPTNKLARKLLFGKNLRRKLISKFSLQSKTDGPSQSGQPVEVNHQTPNEADHGPLEFEDYAHPQVSIVIPVYDGAAFTLQCLKSVHSNTTGIEFEVMVVDDCSQDSTHQMLSEIKGLRLIRNKTNLGFTRSCNRGAEEARGKYLLFLNNDTLAMPHWLDELLKTLETDPKAGAVGAKLVYPDGQLQEAGSILWRDGSALGYGREDDPTKPEYEYLREVDFCSAACLLVRKDLFAELGGFDSRFTPAYYEDADLCMGIREKGFKVLFQPKAIVHHHEYASSTPDRSKNLMESNHLKFVQKWKEQLLRRPEYSQANILRARDRGDQARILVVDDRVPAPDAGSGYPRAYALLIMLAELKYKVSFFPAADPTPYQPSLNNLQQIGVEVILDRAEFASLCAERPGFYDVVLVSRPHNFQKTYLPIKKYLPTARLIYDAEALFFKREELKAKIKGKSVPPMEVERAAAEELRLLSLADAITCVSELEKGLILEKKSEIAHKVFVWGHPLSPQPTSRHFRERKDILFVGAFPVPESPNEDAVVYFLQEILPKIKKEIDCSFSIVGAQPPGSVRKYESPEVRVKGYVKDLSDCYDAFKVFVVPHRYSAGIPLKLSEAMSRGIPAVVSSLTAAQFSLTDGKEVLVGNTTREFASKVIRLYKDEELWNEIRANALTFIQQTHDPALLKSRLAEIVGSTLRGNVAVPGDEILSHYALPTSDDALQKVGEYWAAHESDFQTKRHWTEIPAVRDRINAKKTGNPQMSVFEHVVRKYFLDKGVQPDTCLSLGCGAGDLERELSNYVVPKRHDAIDVSEGLIARAIERAADFPHIHYRVDDLNRCVLPEREYDLILAHQSLHHITNLEGLFEQVKKAMKPHAIFLFDEYIGPSRFQWSDRQIEAINGLMQTLPTWLTVDLEDGHQRRNIVRCTPEQVASVDPSESIRSNEIMSVAARYFETIEFLPYGGTLIHMLLHSIAGNFLTEEAKPWLDLLFRVEDMLLPELGSDFAAAICVIPEK